MFPGSPTHHQPGRRVLNRRFARHYAEMVVVMVLGMVVLGVPAGWLLGAFGSSWDALTDDAPAAMLLLMATTMTVPMAAWMRRMGHAWQPTLEMSASMIVPTLGAIGLLAAGAASVGTLLVVEHVVMLASMFAVMALRPEEYSGHAHHAVPVAA